MWVWVFMCMGAGVCMCFGTLHTHVQVQVHITEGCRYSTRMCLCLSIRLCAARAAPLTFLTLLALPLTGPTRPQARVSAVLEKVAGLSAGEADAVIMDALTMI